MTEFRISKSCLDKSLDLLKNSILPEFKQGNERPLNSSDFDQANKRFEHCASSLNDLLRANCAQTFEDESSSIVSDEFLTLFLIFCGENSEISDWTSDKTFEICNSLLAVVVGSVDSRLSLLTRDQGKIVKKFLFKLRPCLLSDSWKTYPTAVQCYSWCLHSLKVPHVADYLDTLLPTALIITDDFIVENKIIGIKCLHHIINNISLGELQVRSYDEVIYKALEACLLQRDAKLIPILISCVIALLKKIYFLSTDHYSRWSHYDEVMTKLVYQLKLESQTDVKESMLESLVKLMPEAGLLSVRYLDDIVEIVDETPLQPSVALLNIRVVNEMLVTCGPCMKQHLKQVAFIVFKTIYSSDGFKALAKAEIQDACRDVLRRIHISDSGLLEQLVSSPQFNLLREDIRSVVQEAITATT